jgi:hypothetical protein
VPRGRCEFCRWGGIEDRVVSNNTDGTINLILDRLAGNYSVLGPIKIGNNPNSAAVDDLGLDGTPDIVVSNGFSNNTVVRISGAQISVPYPGLSFAPAPMLNAILHTGRRQQLRIEYIPYVHCSITEEKKEIPSES